MHAVLVDGAVIYLGNDGNKAVEIFTSKTDSKASLISVHTLSELASALESEQNHTNRQTLEKGFSQAVERVFEELEEAGVNEKSVEEVVAVLKKRSNKVAVEVKHLGIKGMETVGEGFVALGNLLKVASQDVPKASNGAFTDRPEDSDVD